MFIHFEFQTNIIKLPGILLDDSFVFFSFNISATNTSVIISITNYNDIKNFWLTFRKGKKKL